ncbi:MAG: acyl-CoA thioesterase [Syntrophales bacterium]|nr:acyl-CoA thioesterase [Syntrophales bacterium]MDD5233391.1 acyl-CoA thioesterase [Syntrophales bacterium]MDD5533129.1 acyl-CoA thioesterase [Syntrophales bacterium]HPL64248.1 acyl-CoA thioesterase [Syntrophales bacterium]
MAISDESVLEMRVMPGDVDFYPECNNGRHLTLMDLGRIDLAIRTGLMKTVMKKGWGLMVAGASVRYRYRLRLFDKYKLRTQFAGSDDRWMYFHQWTERDGTVCSSALIRGALTSRSGLVPVKEVFAAIGIPAWDKELPEWVRAWAEAEQLRPG